MSTAAHSGWQPSLLCSFFCHQRMCFLTLTSTGELQESRCSPFLKASFIEDLAGEGAQWRSALLSISPSPVRFPGNNQPSKNPLCHDYCMILYPCDIAQMRYLRSCGWKLKAPSPRGGGWSARYKQKWQTASVYVSVCVLLTSTAFKGWSNLWCWQNKKHT